MKKIFGFLARPIVWSTLALGLLLLTLWVICGLLQLDDQAWLVELLVGTPLTVFLLGYWVHRFLQDRRLTRDLATQARKQATLAGPDALRDFASLEEEFQRAFRELNEACRKRGLVGGAAALPWILVMGPPAVGKTTALERSGLRFTGLGRRLQGIGPTRNCTWWLASDAVFLDTAGRYAVRDEDQQEWAAFLGLLQRRRRQSIDSVVLQVGLDELLDRSPADIERSAVRLRERLDELNQVLGIQIPIHLLFNKTDLLDGFHEFFADLEEAERDRAWGFTLDTATLPVLNEHSVATLFDQRMSELVASLNARVSGRLLVQPTREGREAALGFPAEVEALRAPLRRFVEVLAEAQSGSERPRLAAVYLASAVQTGERRPGGRHRLLTDLGLGSAVRPVVARPAEHSSFLRGVFAQVIRHAENAGRPSAQRLRRLHYEQRAAVGLGMLACLAACWVLAMRYQADQKWLTELASGVKELRDSAGIGEVARQTSDRRLITELAHQQTLLNLLEDRPHGALGRPHRKASEILRQRIDASWLLPLRAQLQQDLQRAARDHYDKPSAFDGGFRLLKAGYILDGEQCEQVSAEETRDAITDYLIGTWQSALGPSSQTLNPREDTDQQPPISPHGQLRRSLQFFFEQEPQEYKKTGLQLDKELRANTRDNLREAGSGNAGIIFQLRASNANLYTKAVQARTRLIVDPGIEQVFTTTGCARFFDKKAATGRRWWRCVLGVEEPKDPIDLEAEYRRRYLEAWTGWLKDLSLQPPAKDAKADPLTRASGTLEGLLHAHRPELTEITQLVGRGREEALLPKSLRRTPLTGCSGWFRKQVTVVRKEARSLDTPGACTQAQAAFFPFTQLTAKPAKDKDPGDDESAPSAPSDAYSSYLEAAKKLTVGLYAIRTMAVSKRPAAALKLVQDTMGGAGDLWALEQARLNLIRELDGRMEALGPNVISDSGLNQKILRQVEHDVWRSLIPYAVKAIDDRWKVDVFDQWTNVKARQKRYTAQDPERVKDTVEFLKVVKEFSKQMLAPLYQNGDPSRCALTTTTDPFAEQLPLSRPACEMMQRFIKVAELTDPNKALGSGGSAPKRPPLNADVAVPSGCKGYNARSVQLDDGENLHTCRINTTNCQHEPSSGKRPSLAVSWGENASFTVYLKGDDYALFVKHPGTVDGNRLTFTLPTKSAPGECAGIKVSFELQPQAGGGGAPARPDNAWREIDLPSSLMGR